jgi:hypothetical protein
MHIPPRVPVVRIAPFVVLCAALLGCGELAAQATENLAPRITLTGISESVRADTLCVTLQAGATLTFGGLSVADADVGDAIVHARVELEPAAGSAASVAIPGLAGLPGVDIIREEAERIRFNAPLTSVNAAFAALEYRAATRGDTLDLIADDLQLPPLSAEFRLQIDTTDAAVAPVAVRCRPPPDLRPESDTGSDDGDDITVATVLQFQVDGLVAGDQVQLLNDDVVIAEAVASDTSLVIADPAPVVGETGLYAVSVNADLGSAAWSVAVVSPQMFRDGFEPLPPPPPP